MNNAIVSRRVPQGSDPLGPTRICLIKIHAPICPFRPYITWINAKLISTFMFITTLSVKNNLRGNYSNFKRFLVNILFLSGFNRPIKYQIDLLVRLSLTL